MRFKRHASQGAPGYRAERAVSRCVKSLPRLALATLARPTTFFLSLRRSPAHLAETIGEEALTRETLAAGAEEFGMSLSAPEELRRPFPYCFEWNGQRICIQFPHRVTAVAGE
jgi:hypothetical protein